MTVDIKSLDSPDKIAAEGERIYAERYQHDFEEKHLGHFVAIDVLTGTAYIAQFPEQALGEARAQAPNGIFHLIRVGAPGAFNVSYGSAVRVPDAFWNRTLRQSR